MRTYTLHCREKEKGGKREMTQMAAQCKFLNRGSAIVTEALDLPPVGYQCGFLCLGSGIAF
jgi:hypothetical protein